MTTLPPDEDPANERPAVPVEPRERALAAREAAVALREADLAAREAAARTVVEREALLAQLRDANERLVLTTIAAHEAAEEAARARAAAEVARDKLAATEIALRSASQRKDEFLAMLGHELRNPLAPIVTALELMKARGETGSLHEREVIERQLRHMIALVDDLLDVSRITSGKIVLVRAPVEISAVVAEAIESVTPLLESRRHTLALSVPERGLLVSGDSGRLAQVLGNLLNNAAKYTDAGGRIWLSASREDAWVRISVKDDGIGMSPDLLAAVFDPFVQAFQTIDRARGGLGLGLALVQRLVTLHGGRVGAYSGGHGQGSEFVVRLPALVDEAAAGVTTDAGGPERTGAAARRARRVLLVDDNADASELLAAALAADDREVTVAHDGPAALEAMETFEPDAMVIDIGLPVMDGYELARVVRERERTQARVPGIRLVALTGYGQSRDRERGLAAGMDAYLVKPVSVPALEEALTLDVPVPPASSA